MRAVAFSPDGKSVLTGSEDNTARLWDTAWLVQDIASERLLLMTQVSNLRKINARADIEAIPYRLARSR